MELVRDVPMDQFAAMRTFVRVVEVGTFTHAANALAMPKPTVSKLIQALEAHLSTKLLHRTTRRVTVTPDGAAYYERAVRLLAELDELDGSMTSSQARPSGKLRVDVGASLALQIIIPALPDFHAAYPEIQLDLGVSDRPVDMISENVDCVVRAGQLKEQSLIARRIGDMDFAACAAPSYLERHGVPEHPRDLETGHHIIGYFKSRSGGTHALPFIRDGERLEIAGRYLLAVNDSNAYVAAGIAGLGILYAPTFLVAPHLADGKLQPVLPEWHSDIYPLHVVYPPNRHISNRVRVFVEWVADLLARSGFTRRRTGEEARPHSPASFDPVY
jgi:DNA-binding transcriptional LysR family regulator